MNIDLNKLSEFLVKAKRATYASGNEDIKIINDDKSTTIIFESENWKYHDNYFGGEPYGGREVVFYKNMPIYIMVYYGKIYNTTEKTDEVYKTLMNALKLITEDAPYRGPKEYIENNMKYKNVYSGNITNFQGTEIILKDKQKIYEAHYVGGLVDR